MSMLRPSCVGSVLGQVPAIAMSARIRSKAYALLIPLNLRSSASIIVAIVLYAVAKGFTSTHHHSNQNRKCLGRRRCRR